MSRHEEFMELTRDMASDALNEASKYNRRVSRNVSKYGERAVVFATFPNAVWGRIDFPQDFSALPLASKFTLEVMQPAIEEMAGSVGFVALSKLCDQSNLGSSFFYKNKLYVPEIHNEISMSTFTRKVWAPDYAERFADGWMMQNYPDEFARAQTAVSELEQLELGRSGGMDMSDGRYRTLGMEN